MSLRSNYSSASSTDWLVAILGLGFIVLWGAAIIGWIWNIAKIVGAVAEPITTLFILRVVGVLIAPLGAVLGWF